MKDEKNISDKFGFTEALNRHGHPFHYRMVQEAANAFKSKNSTWRLAACEFPVRVRDHDSRIDFILRSLHGLTLLIAECKRVNPAMGRWCFARAPFTRF